MYVNIIVKFNVYYEKEKEKDKLVSLRLLC
jgi:hypothetical protein